MIIERLPEITSKDNPIIKSVRALKTKKGRQEQNRCLIEGKRLCSEAIFCGMIPSCTLISKDFIIEERDRLFLGRVISNGFPVYRLPQSVLESCADTASPQGIVMVLDKRPLVSITDISSADLTVVLDGIRDPGNAGTIIRTAKAVGADMVFMLNSVDLYSPKTLRSAMGAIFSQDMRIMESSSHEDVYEILCRIKARILVASADGEDLFSGRLDLSSPIAWVFGSEACGISSFFRHKASETVGLPMPGGTESLNVAVSAGIMLYETLRRNSV